MTIEDARKLINDENNGELRLPKVVVSGSEQELAEKENLAVCVWNMFGKPLIPKSTNLTYKRIVKDKPKGKVNKKVKFNLIIKTIIRNSDLVESLDVEIEDKTEVYKLKTKLFEGEFFDAVRFFKGKKWPKWLKPNNCYENSYILCLMFGRDAKGMETKQVTGIISSDMQKSYIHSVCWVKTKQGKEFVLDSNAHLFMGYDLYKKLFNFEALNEISLEELKEGKPYILEYAKECEAKGGDFKNSVGSLSWQDAVARMKGCVRGAEIV